MKSQLNEPEIHSDNFQFSIRSQLRNLTMKTNPTLNHRLPLFALLLGLVLTLGSRVTMAALPKPPDKMAYQGFLVDANGAALAPDLPGNYSVVFRIYDASSGGNIIWSEQQIVTVDKGNFSVVLGEGTEVSGEPRPALSTAFTGATASDRYLGIFVTISGTTMTISPRLRLLPSPYAFVATAATSLVNNSGQTLLSLANGRLEGAADLSVAGNIGSSGSLAGFLFANRDGTSVWQWYSTGGTARLWDSAAGDRMAVSSAGNVGIGTTAPENKLHVQGGVIVTGGYGTSGTFNTLTLGGGAGTPNSGSLAWGNNGGWKLNFGTPVSGTFTPRVTFVDTGNVGIGTTSPATTLDIGPGPHWRPLTVRGSGGTDVVVMGNLSGKATIAGHTGALGDWADLVLNPFGNVGIGTSSPSAKLHLSGSMKIDGNSYIEFGAGIAGKEASAGRIGYDIFGEGALHIVGAGGTAGARNIQMWDRVGIGTGAPSAPLVVNGSGAQTVGAHAAFTSDGGIGAVGVATYNLVDVSIIATHAIHALHFRAVSDARIKNVLGRSNGTADLNTLNRIEITNYKYKDVLTKGSRTQKKVIGQQVEEVFPQAVVQTVDVVPDIYKRAHTEDGWVTLATNLKRGERVRMISKTHDAVHEVLEVTPDKFRTDFIPEEDAVFVFGREVNDFRVVDYEAIAMLNVSATQELTRRMEALKQSEARIVELEARASKVDALEREVAELRGLHAKAARVDSLEQEVSDLRRLVTQLASATRKVSEPVTAVSPRTEATIASANR